MILCSNILHRPSRKTIMNRYLEEPCTAIADVKIIYKPDYYLSISDISERKKISNEK